MTSTIAVIAAATQLTVTCSLRKFRNENIDIFCPFTMTKIYVTLNLRCRNTVWKFHDFSITQILREIKFGDSRSAKSVTFTHLEALNSDFHEFLHFLKAEIYQINKIQSP